MTRKERMDYLLARLPEEKKEEFMSEFRGAVSDEARSDVVKKYCTVYAPGIMETRRRGRSHLCLLSRMIG